MPHTASAAKRLRQSLERRTRNRDQTTELKTIRKNFLRAIHDGKRDEAQGLYRELAKSLDQAASKNVIHANRAARVKSRMAKVLAAPAAAPVVKTRPPAKADKAKAKSAPRAAKVDKRAPVKAPVV